MERKDSTALVAVPTASTAIALRKSKQDSKLLLADGDVVLTNREEVRNRLPDILGRALARAWLDLQFEKDFMTDPLRALADSGVHLPSTMLVEVSKTTADRPKIVVYEQQQGSKFKSRVLYLQLVMVAGK
jgi:hypothetical protein